jgi:hypothetical protein
MNRFAKTLFWISISWIFICLFILTVGQYFPFAFSNENTAQGFYGLVACTFPIAVILTSVRPSKNRVYKAATIIVAIISIPIPGLYSFETGMCGYITDNVFFISKSDSSLKIIERHLASKYRQIMTK